MTEISLETLSAESRNRILGEVEQTLKTAYTGRKSSQKRKTFCHDFRGEAEDGTRIRIRVLFSPEGARLGGRKGTLVVSL